MITDNPVLHEQQHQLLTLMPQFTANRPTTGNRVGERRLDPTTGIEWFWTGSAWQQVTTNFLTQTFSADVWANRPGSPINGQLFYAIDRQTLYFWYSPTSRWFTTQLFEVPIFTDAAYANPSVISTSGAAFGRGAPLGTGTISTNQEFQIWYHEIVCATAATMDATHFWSVNVAVVSSANSPAEVVGTVCRTAAKTTAGNVYKFSSNGNGVVYNDTTCAYIYSVPRNNVNGSVGTGTGNLSIYRQALFIRIAG